MGPFFQLGVAMLFRDTSGLGRHNQTRRRNTARVKLNIMSTPEPPIRRIRAGHGDRDRVIDSIQRAHADGRITDTELTERRDRVTAATYLDELPALLEDLPEYEGWQLMPQPSQSANLPAPVAPTDVATSDPYGNTPVAAESNGGWTMSVMSGKDVIVEPGTTEINNFAWWGGDTYDLTEAMGPGRTITMNLHAIMAGSDIRVPEGVRVIDKSLAIMAGNDVAEDAQGDGSNGTLIIAGFLWWAGNEVKLANEKWLRKQDRKRHRN